jgi:hypothetical protein
MDTPTSWAEHASAARQSTLRANVGLVGNLRPIISAT